MQISAKKSTMVYPAEETPKHRLWSTNLELLMTLHHVPTVYFFRPNGYSNFFDPQVLMEALSKVTRFKCGGVCLGIGLQHTLGDGAAGIHFINSWAEMARGLPLSTEPFIDRSLLRARVPPTPTFHHVEYDPPLSMNTVPTTEESDPQTTVSIFKINRDQLNTLKAKANKNENSGNYSTYNSLAAHIWRCANKARCLPDDQATKLYIPIDGRSRLRPPLPPSYLGNVIFMSATIASHGDLQSESFSDTAKRIQNILKRIDDEYLRSAIDYMEKVPNVKAPVRGARGFQCPNLSINSWMWLPIYEADFGWGRPNWLRPAKVSQDGKTYILPSSVKDGSLSVVTC
ncbi:hypothetical protein CRYUN_Cryun02cG0058300 [Craigia yunnanensis]